MALVELLLLPLLASNARCVGVFANVLLIVWLSGTLPPPPSDTEEDVSLSPVDSSVSDEDDDEEKDNKEEPG